MEYKILNLGGYALTIDVEETLNALAREGWRVITSCEFGIVLGRELIVL